MGRVSEGREAKCPFALYKVSVTTIWPYELTQLMNYGGTYLAKPDSAKSEAAVQERVKPYVLSQTGKTEYGKPHFAHHESDKPNLGIC